MSTRPPEGWFQWGREYSRRDAKGRRITVRVVTESTYPWIQFNGGFEFKSPLYTLMDSLRAALDDEWVRTQSEKAAERMVNEPINRNGRLFYFRGKHRNYEVSLHRPMGGGGPNFGSVRNDQGRLVATFSCGDRHGVQDIRSEDGRIPPQGLEEFLNKTLAPGA